MSWRAGARNPNDPEVKDKLDHWVTAWPELMTDYPMISTV
jgi:hypothetical protein